MREGEAALIPEAVAAVQRGDIRLVKMFAEDLESSEGRLLEQNAQQFDGLYNSNRVPRDLRRRSTGRRAASMIETSGVYGFNARNQQVAGLLPGVARARRPAAERQHGHGRRSDPAAERHLRLADAPCLGCREAAAAPAGFAPCRFPRPGLMAWWSSRMPCAARLRDASSIEPTPSARLTCRGDNAAQFYTACRLRARPHPMP